jgi:hypothetical protein
LIVSMTSAFVLRGAAAVGAIGLLTVIASPVITLPCFYNRTGEKYKSERQSVVQHTLARRQRRSGPVAQGVDPGLGVDIVSP